MQATTTYSRTAICAMLLAIYASAAHAQRQAPIRDLGPVIENSVIQQYQAPLSATETARSNPTTSELAQRELHACLERKQQIDQQQQKLANLAADLNRDKQLVNQLALRIEQDKPKRVTHSAAAMSAYQALLRQYEQQVTSLNDRTLLYNQLAEQNAINARQYNKICSGKSYRATQLPADSSHAVQPMRHTPATAEQPGSAVPGIPSVGN